MRWCVRRVLCSVRYHRYVQLVCPCLCPTEHIHVLERKVILRRRRLPQAVLQICKLYDQSNITYYYENSELDGRFRCRADGIRNRQVMILVSRSTARCTSTEKMFKKLFMPMSPRLVTIGLTAGTGFCWHALQDLSENTKFLGCLWSSFESLWHSSSDVITRWNDAPASVLPVIRKLIHGGIRVWVFR